MDSYCKSQRGHFPHYAILPHRAQYALLGNRSFYLALDYE
jgi:hypothetical protein